MITKRDERRYRFAIAMESHRSGWARKAFKHVVKAQKFDHNHVTLIMRATDSTEAAFERIKSYFKVQSRVYWANALRIIWKETGKASITVIRDVLTREDFFGDYSTITEITKDPIRENVQSSWDKLVEDKISSRTNKVSGVTQKICEQTREIFVLGNTDGLTHHEIGQQFESTLVELWKAQSETFARTEVNSAMNAAMLEAAKAMAPDLNKVWACAFVNSRQDHMDADGQSIPQSEPFMVGGEEMMEPGDDLASVNQIVNCTCSIYFEPPGEAAN
ncbi:MAG: hypothetical protein ACXVIX_00940 [Halobacteriota archaeon]